MKILFVKLGNSRLSVMSPKSIRHFKRSQKAKFQSYLKRNADLIIFCSVLKNSKAFLPSKVKLQEIKTKDIPFRFAYRKGLGVDRALNIYAASEIWGGPVVVVDLGTALCADFVDSRGKHLGGWIAAGPGIAAVGLHKYTSKLPLVVPRRLKNDLGHSTKASILHGLMAQLDGYILSACTTAKKVFKSSRFNLVLTGGWSSLLSLPKASKYEEHLTLLALKKIWESQTMER